MSLCEFDLLQTWQRNSLLGLFHHIHLLLELFHLLLEGFVFLLCLVRVLLCHGELRLELFLTLSVDLKLGLCLLELVVRGV